MKWNNSVARKFFHCPQLEVPFYLRGSDVERNSLYSTGMGSQTCHFFRRTRTTKSFGHTSVLIKTRTDYTFNTIVAIKLTGAFSDMHPEVSSPSSQCPPSMTGVTSHSDTPFLYTIQLPILTSYSHIYSSLKLSNKCFF